MMVEPTGNKALQTLWPRTGPDMAAVMALRNQVFVIEQKFSPEIDVDGRDGDAVHVLFRLEGRAVACGRFLPVDREQVRLSRITVTRDCRGQGLGAKVVLALEQKAHQLGYKTAILSAHQYLEAFYRGLGYQPTGKRLKIEGVPLVFMDKTLCGFEAE